LQIKDAGKKHCYRMWTRTLTEYLRQSSQMDSWQTVFVFRDRCVERVDTPELVQPMELDRAQANKERKRALDKAYREKNADSIKVKKRAYCEKNKDKSKAYYENNKERLNANDKAYYEKNIEKKRIKKKIYRKQNADSIYASNRKYKENNADSIYTSNRKYKEKNADSIKVSKRAWKLRNHGCIKCIEWPVDQQVGLPHYDGYCFRCFCDEFPHDERVKTKARVELRVRAYLNSHFAGFVHDHQMPTAHCVCDHRRRIDHRMEIGNTLLCIETDEHHHRNYDKDDESARYHDMLMGWGGKLVFIRFNPDGKGPPLEDRLERLHAEITRHIGRLERGENSALLEVWHLYYPKGTEDYCGEAIAPEGL
jgi:hypothetical protein